VTELLFKDEVYTLVGAAMTVCNELGLLFNLGEYEKLEWERWVRSHQFAQISLDSRKKNG